MSTPLSPNLQINHSLFSVLDVWRDLGRSAAVARWNELHQHHPAVHHHPIGYEIYARLNQHPGPRVLVDGIWFSRPHGGISRVWEQILSTWRLDGFLSDSAPIGCLDRDTHLASCNFLELIDAPRLDPLNPVDIIESLDGNAKLSKNWFCDVFISSWITTCSMPGYRCRELALVHDCIPERSIDPDPALLRARSLWLSNCSLHLAVSASTAADLQHFYPSVVRAPYWCHPCPDLDHPYQTDSPLSVESLWQSFSKRAGIPPCFVLLPGTSSIGSYKNPEILAAALSMPNLASVQLVISGINAARYASDLEYAHPNLRNRILAVGCTRLELQHLYRHALAVVVPSRIEGFGLPVTEAMLSGGIVLVADAPGLREAGSIAALRFDTECPKQLAAQLQLLLDPVSSNWLRMQLLHRAQKRLSIFHPDALGISLLAMARQLWIPTSMGDQPLAPHFNF